MLTLLVLRRMVAGTLLVLFRIGLPIVAVGAIVAIGVFIVVFGCGCGCWCWWKMVKDEGEMGEEGRDEAENDCTWAEVVGIVVDVVGVLPPPPIIRWWENKVVGVLLNGETMVSSVGVGVGIDNGTCGCGCRSNCCCCCCCC